MSLGFGLGIKLLFTSCGDIGLMVGYYEVEYKVRVMAHRHCRFTVLEICCYDVSL